MSSTVAASAYDAMLSALVESISTLTEQANAIAEKASKSTGDARKQIRDYIESSDDEAIVTYREWEAKQKARLAEALTNAQNHAAEKLGLSLGMSDAELAKAKDEHKQIRSVITSTTGNLTKMSEMLGLDVPALPTLLNFSGKPSAGGASGSRRPRFDDVILNGVSLKSQGKAATFSTVSQQIKSDTGVSMSAGEIYAAFAKECETDEWTEFSHVEVEFTATDPEKVIHSYKVMPIVESDDDDTEEAESTEE